jgi:hypothetical protein
MSSVTLYRASGLALLLGAVLVIVGLPLSFVFTPDSPMALAMIGVWTGGVVLTQLGLPGIVARQAKQVGWLGFAGYLLAGSGGFLLASFFAVLDLTVFPYLDVHAPLASFQFFTTNAAMNVYAAVASALFGVGWLLLGIATMRARVFPRGASLLLILGVVGLAGFVNVFLSLAMVFGLLGLGWIGFALLTAQGKAVPQPILAS